jgi:DNA adenine methylase
MGKLTQPIKWHGGKHYLAPKIVALMPPRCKNPNKPDLADPGWLHYVEPFAGGLSVLLANDPEGISEVVNDLNGELTNFWGVMRDLEEFGKFQRQLEATPFSECEHQWACQLEGDPRQFESHPWRRAVAFFVRCRQSLSGRMNGFAGITRNRTRKGMNEQVSAWLNCVEGLPAVHERMMRVLVRNRPALEIIQKEDGPRTLFYLDPPYLHETRATTGEYEHEMTDEQHGELLEVLGSVKGRFLLSGYRSELYDDGASACKWARHDFDLPNNSAGGKEKQRRAECVWCNF